MDLRTDSYCPSLGSPSEVPGTSTLSKSIPHFREHGWVIQLHPELGYRAVPGSRVQLSAASPVSRFRRTAGSAVTSRGQLSPLFLAGCRHRESALPAQPSSGAWNRVYIQGQNPAQKHALLMARTFRMPLASRFLRTPGSRTMKWILLWNLFFYKGVNSVQIFKARRSIWGNPEVGKS